MNADGSTALALVASTEPLADVTKPKEFQPTDKWVVGMGKSIMYRYFDDNSQGSYSKDYGFKSGYLHRRNRSTAPVPPPLPFSPVFRAAARIHLERKESPDGSPFISLWGSPLPALHRALRSSANAFIAVIDGRRFSLCQPYDYPSLFPCRVVVNDLPQQDELPREWYYNGMYPQPCYFITASVIGFLKRNWRGNIPFTQFGRHSN